MIPAGVTGWPSSGHHARLDITLGSTDTRCAQTTLMTMNILMARSGPEVPNAHLDG